MTNQSTVSTYDINNLPVYTINTISCKYEQRQSRNESVKSYLMSILKLLIGFSVMFVLISVPFEYMRLYEKAKSQKMSKVLQGKPPNCNPENKTLFETIKEFVIYYFSWTHTHSPCEDYYYALQVDPLWEVTPAMVWSSVISRTILHSLELISGSLGKIVRLFFSEIPAQWQPVFVIILVIMTILLLIMMFKYRLSVPWLFRIEPKCSPICQNIASDKSFSETVHKNGISAEKLEFIPIHNSDSRKKCLLTSLATNRTNNFNYHNVPEYGPRSLTVSRKFVASEISRKISHLSPASTSSDSSSWKQSVLLCSNKELEPEKRNGIEIEEVKQKLKFRKTLSADKMLTSNNTLNIKESNKLSRKPVQRQKSVSKKKIKENDPLWTPDNDD